MWWTTRRLPGRYSIAEMYMSSGRLGRDHEAAVDVVARRRGSRSPRAARGPGRGCPAPSRRGSRGAGAGRPGRPRGRRPRPRRRGWRSRPRSSDWSCLNFGADAGVGLPGGHPPVLGHRGDVVGPLAGLLVGLQRERADLARAVALLAVLLEDRGDVPGVGRPGRRPWAARGSGSRPPRRGRRPPRGRRGRRRWRRAARGSRGWRSASGGRRTGRRSGRGSGPGPASSMTNASGVTFAPEPGGERRRRGRGRPGTSGRSPWRARPTSASDRSGSTQTPTSRERPAGNSLGEPVERRAVGVGDRALGRVEDDDGRPALRGLQVDGRPSGPCVAQRALGEYAPGRRREGAASAARAASRGTGRDRSDHRRDGVVVRRSRRSPHGMPRVHRSVRWLTTGRDARFAMGDPDVLVIAFGRSFPDPDRDRSARRVRSPKDDGSTLGDQAGEGLPSPPRTRPTVTAMAAGSGRRECGVGPPVLLPDASRPSGRTRRAGRARASPGRGRGTGVRAGGRSARCRGTSRPRTPARRR